MAELELESFPTHINFRREKKDKTSNVPIRQVVLAKFQLGTKLEQVLIWHDTKPRIDVVQLLY